jgi:hypothetical protein
MCVIVGLFSAAPGPSSIPAGLIRTVKFGSRATTRFMSVTRTAVFKIRFHFCPNCGSTPSWHGLPERAGSSIFWEGDRNPNIYGITVGSFADPNFPPPTYSVWEEVMHPWLGVATATEHFPQGRPLTR